MTRRVSRDFPSPELPFRYRSQPRSGNEINGLGEPVFRRAVQVFHGSGARELEWRKLELFFALINPFRVYWLNLVNRWLLRRADGPVAKTRQPVADPRAMAKAIKQRACELGAGAAGIAALTEKALYQDYQPDYPHAIVVLMPMDSQEMAFVTTNRAGAETMRAYMEITRTVIALAEHIRAMGWRARAYGEAADILHIPLAIDAGLGQLGKHGSLICREFGSSMRIATVLTDLPLAHDAPVDIAVDDLCLGCRRCSLDCPVDAIADHKQMVRGEEKWYVDFDRCAPYFTHTVGCGICIEVCPWTIP
ncbi:MAG: 4Fe-4S dicluster domain-containing protein, partial [Halioglobus sp.]